MSVYVLFIVLVADCGPIPAVPGRLPDNPDSTVYSVSYDNKFAFVCADGFTITGASEHGIDIEVDGSNIIVSCQMDSTTRTVYWDFGSLKCLGTF